MTRTRLLFADQLGPHFDDGGPLLVIEAASPLRRRTYHRQKAHLIRSAMRHRVAELGDRVEVVRADTYREVLERRDDLEVVAPTSYGLRKLVAEFGLEVLPSRGFVTSEQDFGEWAAERDVDRTRMETFYRWVRERTGILMNQRGGPLGGTWNYDHDNREAPPKGEATLGLPDPWWPDEDGIDDEVRHDLDLAERRGDATFVGVDGPRRFAATHREAMRMLDDFARHRLRDFGRYEDAILEHDPWMAHSLLSPAMNLGLLDPADVVDRVRHEYDEGRAPLRSVEGVTRQIIGWRDWVWHLYWHFGERYVRESNALDAHRDLPKAWRELDPSNVRENCLAHALEGVRDHAWAHHIQRLMVLGNWALQRGYDPRQATDWFVDAFADGTPWVMPANVAGMALHADGGRMATKPYASGGAYIDRMSDHCGGCRFDPKVRVGETACPFTAGYWAFLARNEERLQGNQRMTQPLAGLRRLKDLDAVVEQESHRRGL